MKTKIFSEQKYFRNREPHLRTFLHNIHRFVQKQQLDYAIFIVEQLGNKLPFNKGRLTNIGVLEVIIFIFNVYICIKCPKYMLKYILTYVAPD